MATGRRPTSRPPQRPDPIGGYIEWTNHRYDPGYYLGGNIVPLLRKSTLGRKGRRLSGIWLAISGGMAIGSIAAFATVPPGFSFWELLLEMAMASLIVGAAAAMLRSTTTEPKSRRRSAQRQ